MTVPGIDYAWQHPDPAAVAKAGYGFACRYLSRDDTKNLSLGEAQALAANGIWVVANWEYGAQDMLRGYAGGIADAQLALAQATAAGMPAGRPVYFSADWDVTPAQEAAVLAYLSGADSVLGASSVGEYGGYYPVKIARDQGTAWSWQTSGWSGGQWDPRDQIRQTGTATVGGVQVDVNQAMTDDYGQWQPGRLPAAAQPAPLPRSKGTTVDLISVTPDPTNPSNPSSTGIFGVYEGLGVIHFDGTTWAKSSAAYVAQYGPVKPVSVDFYNRAVALSGRVQFVLTDAQVAALAADIAAGIHFPASPTVFTGKLS